MALTENLAVFLDFVGLVTVVGGSALVAVVESERYTNKTKDWALVQSASFYCFK